MVQDTTNLPKSIVDKIMIQAEIAQLLDTSDEYETEPKKINPYSLEVDPRITLEDSDGHGVKELPPATKRLRPAATSMFEHEIMRTVDDDVEVPQILGTSYTKINIPGIPGDFYLKTSLLRNAMTEFLYETEIRSYKGGDVFIAKYYIDNKLLAENCISRKYVSC